MRVLVVEDDQGLAERLQRTLEREGYAVDVAGNGIDGEFLGDEALYDAAVLDLGLPGRPGLEVLANWRKRHNDIPVIVLTARDAWHERVDGLRAGADDYLGKPFHDAELLARMQAVVRRRHGRADPLLRVGDLTLDETRQTLTRGNAAAVELTATEFRLLRYFMLHPGRVLSKSRLTAHIYEEDGEPDSNVLEVYVRRLRGLLGKERIETRRGQGYLFRSEVS